MKKIILLFLATCSTSWSAQESNAEIVIKLPPKEVVQQSLKDIYHSNINVNLYSGLCDKHATPTQLFNDFDAIVEHMRQTKKILNPNAPGLVGTEMGNWIAKTQNRQRAKIFRAVLRDYPQVIQELEKEGKL